MTKPSLVERMEVWFSKGQVVDGLWVGSSQWDPEPAIERVEAALRLIERCAPLHYLRVKNSLARIWVHLVPHGAGCYLHSLNACVLDERIVASETITIEWIASAIVHEATHARLEKLGIRYVEAARVRIERICICRELDFVRRLSGAAALQEEITQNLNRCRGENSRYTDQNMWQQIDQGNAEILRYLGAPEWVTALAFRTRNPSDRIRRFMSRCWPRSRPDGQITSRFSRLAVKSPSQKYSDFQKPQIRLQDCPSCSARGALAIVTNVGAGCGGRGCALDERRVPRTAKTCGPDTPTLVSSSRSKLRGRWWQESPVARESAP